MLWELGQRVILAVVNITFLLRSSYGGFAAISRGRCIAPATAIFRFKYNQQSLPSRNTMRLLMAEDDIVSSKKKNSLQLYLEGRDTTARLVPLHDELLPNSVEVKSLIWEYDGCPVVVVLDGSKHVDVDLLAEYCGVSPSDMVLASPERAVQLGGNTVSDPSLIHFYSTFAVLLQYFYTIFTALFQRFHSTYTA